MVIFDWAVTALLFVVLVFSLLIATIGYVMEHFFEFVRFTFNKLRGIIIISTTKRS